MELSTSTASQWPPALLGDLSRMSPTRLPSVCLIISHLNSKATIGNCIAGLLLQDYPWELYKILVVDGGSSDGSIDIINALKRSNLSQIVVPGCSEGEGIAIGVQSSDSEVIMFTNSDIYVPPNWIRKHVEWLGKGFDLVGGKVFWGGDKYSLTWNTPAPEQPRYLPGEGLGSGFSNCSISRESLIRMGGLLYLTAHTDTEFGYRLIKCGGKMVLDPSIEVYHDHPLGSLSLSFTRSFRYARNHIVIMRGVFGKTVSGSGTPKILALGTWIREWTLINAVRTYKEIRPKAYRRNIRVSLIEFLLIYILSTKLGQVLGVIAGVTKKGVELSSKNIQSPQFEKTPAA